MKVHCCLRWRNDAEAGVAVYKVPWCERLTACSQAPLSSCFDNDLQSDCIDLGCRMNC